jgi:hypothetical protein
MKIICLLSASCFLVLFSISSAAQNKPVKPATAQPAAKFKPPKLYTAIGTKKDSIITVNSTEAVALINQPLVVTDDKKGVYTISSYQCMYKRRAVTEDEETGKVTPITSNAIQRFSSTPLSEIWRRTIGEQLRSGEEISFFDIVVKDAQNRLMFAPAIKIVVK